MMQEPAPDPVPTVALDRFIADPQAHLDRLRASGEAVSLDFNGKSAAVMMSVEAYNKLLDELDHAELMADVTRSQTEIAQGKVRPAEEVFDDIRRKLLERIASREQHESVA